jgi:peptide chain release factor 1
MISDDLRVDLIRQDEPGGQKVGTGQYLVQVTHIQSGMSVSISDRRGQHRARSYALTLMEMMVEDFG